MKTNPKFIQAVNASDGGGVQSLLHPSLCGLNSVIVVAVIAFWQFSQLNDTHNEQKKTQKKNTESNTQQVDKAYRALWIEWISELQPWHDAPRTPRVRKRWSCEK